MSPGDLAFLKAIGVKPEEIAPASKEINGHRAVYETCPMCSGRRHRFLDNGQVFCLSCDARRQRELRYEQALARANSNEDRLYIQRVNVPYRGFEVAHLDGVGWCYRLRGDNIFGHWMKAQSFLDAQRRVDRVSGPELRPESDEPLARIGECIECGSPCGPVRYCHVCGKAQLGHEDGR